MTAAPVRVSFELSEPHALALAQFCKRVGWQEFRANAVDDEEAYEIRAAVDTLQAALREAGYAPR